MARELVEVMTKPVSANNRMRRMRTFTRLDARHFIRRMDLDSRCRPLEGEGIDAADLLYADFKLVHVTKVGIQPIFAAMGFSVGFVPIPPDLSGGDHRHDITPYRRLRQGRGRPMRERDVIFFGRSAGHGNDFGKLRTGNFSGTPRSRGILPGRSGALRLLSPLRTGRDSFPSSGSSPSAASYDP